MWIQFSANNWRMCRPAMNIHEGFGKSRGVFGSHGTPFPLPSDFMMKSKVRSGLSSPKRGLFFLTEGIFE